MKQSYIIEKAINEAKKSNHRLYKIGAVIFTKKQIVSVGHNSLQKSVRRFKKEFIRWENAIHAETAAIISAKRDLKGCEMLVVRLTNGGRLSMAKPCRHCMGYIEYVGIRKIHFSDRNEEIQEIKI